MSIKAILVGRRIHELQFKTHGRKPHIIKRRGAWQVYSPDKPTWQMPTFQEIGKYWGRFT